MRHFRWITLILLLVASLSHPSATRADEPPTGKWCSDLTTLPPNARRTPDRVLYGELESGRFPEAIFPLGRRGQRMLFFDDQRRVLSERAATGVLENHVSSHDLILLWRNAVQEEFNVKAAAAATGAMAYQGLLMNPDYASVTYYQIVTEANEGKVEAASNQSAEYFSQAVCAFNSFKASQRQRASESAP